jgi:hypothetical protein
MFILIHWFIYPKVHGCGPIKDGYYGWFYFEEWIQSTGFLNFLYDASTSYPVLWIAIGGAVIFTKLKSNSSKVYKEYVSFKEKEYGHTIKTQDSQIFRLKQKIEI